MTLVKLSDILKSLFDKNNSNELIISGMNESLEIVNKQRWAISENITKLSEKIIEIFGARAGAHRSKNLTGEFDELAGFEFHEDAVCFRDAAVKIYESHMDWLRRIEEKLGCVDDDSCKKF